jgi:hypothetical protein
MQGWITRENVNELIRAGGFSGELGLLSVDIDGNDYWVFDAIEAVRPAIAIVEYNHRFGPERSVTIPYDPAWSRRQTDDSYLASGASLGAITGAARRKGLALVGCNSFGNNAFFVRADLLSKHIPERTVQEAFVAGRFREPIVRHGSLAYLTPAEESELIAHAKLVEVP